MPVSILLVPVLVEAVPMLLFLLRDLTGRELASEVLVQERGTLAAAMESTDVDLIVCDPLGLDAVLDATALALLEFPSQEAYEGAVVDGEAGWEASYPDGRTIPPDERPLARAVRGDFVRNFDMRYRSPRTGSEWDCRLNIVPVRDADGEVTVIVQTLLDVTASRAAEQERQRSTSTT